MALQVHYLPQLLSEVLGCKVVNERINAAIHTAETERQFVGHVGRFVVEEPEHTVNQQEDVVRCKANGEDQENKGGQAYRSLFLGCLGISGQFANDTDIAKGCDTEREEEEQDHHAEDEQHPGLQCRQHVFLQHIKASCNPEVLDFKGQVCGHERV